MAAKLVLITGATGFIGFRILLDVLKAGHRVRVVVRSREKADSLSHHPKLKDHYERARFDFSLVQDFAELGAWDEALRDVTHIMHVASPLPLPFLNPQKDIYEPSTQGNDNLLLAALRTTNLERIILTSSIVATMPLAPRSQGPYNATTVVDDPAGPFENVYDAYQAAKIHLLRASREIVERHAPRFDVISILPGYTFGRNEMAQSATQMFTSSNAVLLMLLQGKKFPVDRITGVAHLDDVAAVHVCALDQSIKGNSIYGVSVSAEYNKAIAITRNHFPDAFEKGIFADGDQPSEIIEWNATDTETKLGMKFKRFEEMVVDVVAQYLNLMKDE
ncbi:cinnamoyl-CoA reductase [Lophiostoma macrostomum CBS 122681]|uniref:Cinnamoyl-CoA reductase n=1 Tax=Lophiostoma macrostomum CBS 122681 TaxID=1314788 RepID=A0A6A6SWN6_9PLEO|nr:cinnamoyl-CoA reductase [Lophiostoma macrostomum CBS 122681]